MVELTEECLGMLMSTGLFVVAHSEDPGRLYGTLIDGVFTSGERARKWLKALCSKEDTTTYFIYRFFVNSDQREMVFRGTCREA